MNSFSIFGIFIVLLFAYYTPTQGQAIAVSYVAFENGERYEFTNFIRTPDGAYKFEKRDGTFGIEGIDTIAGKDVVLRMNDKSYIQMELANANDSQKLFAMTTRPKLPERSTYSYGISAIYGYSEGLIREKVSFSGYQYSTTGKPQHRPVVHTKTSLTSTESEPLLLWTENDFNYQICGTGLLLALNAKPADKVYKYYFLKFCTPSYRYHWIDGHGRKYTNNTLSFPKQVCDYFKTK